MNQAAKIALVTGASYLIVRLLPSLFMVGNILINKPSLESIFVSIASFAITILYIWLLVHFLIIKREKLAQKIVGDTDTPTSTNPAAWLPLAYRLACVTVGLILTYHVIWNFVAEIYRYTTMKNLASTQARQMFSGGFSQINLSSLIMLPLAIYLLCGAPHFVRWQVKKTLEFCDTLPDNEENPQTNTLQTGE